MNELDVSLQQSITTLAGHGWSQRKIARELGVHRETVGRYLARTKAAAKPAMVPLGSPEPGDSKPAIPPIGSAEVADAKPAIVPIGSKAGRTANARR